MPSKSFNPNNVPYALTGTGFLTPLPSKAKKDSRTSDNKVLTGVGFNWIVSGMGMTLIACAGCFAIIFGILAGRKEENRADRLAAVLDEDAGLTTDAFAFPDT